MKTVQITPFGTIMGVLVALIWGLSFSVASFAQNTFSPWAFALLRFTLSFIPLAFFLNFPKTKVKYLIAYGLSFGFIQFALFLGSLKVGLAPGIASILDQSNVYFTIIITALISKKLIDKMQTIGLIISIFAFGILFFIEDGSAPLAGIILILGSGLMLAISNVFVKLANPESPLAFLIWASAIPIIPLIIVVSFFDKDSKELIHNLDRITPLIILSVFFSAYIAGVLAFTIWNTLLKKYNVDQVMTINLLIPVFGMFFGKIFTHESIGTTKIIACILLFIAFFISQFGYRIVRKLSKKTNI